jgi:hypothetical protein
MAALRGNDRGLTRGKTSIRLAVARKKTIDGSLVLNNRAAPSQRAALLSRARLNVSLLGVLLGVSGCQSMSPVKGPVEASDGPVEIRITPARTLDVRDRDGSRTSLEAVSRARGSIPGVRGDSVTFRIDSWRGGSPVGDHKPTWAQTVLSASDPEVTFFRDRVSVTKNLVMVAVVVALVSLAIGQASVGGY